MCRLLQVTVVYFFMSRGSENVEEPLTETEKETRGFRRNEKGPNTERIPQVKIDILIACKADSLLISHLSTQHEVALICISSCRMQV